MVVHHHAKDHEGDEKGEKGCIAGITAGAAASAAENHDVSWEISYNRFCRGQDFDTIASKPINRKMVEIGTFLKITCPVFEHLASTGMYRNFVLPSTILICSAWQTASEGKVALHQI